jgi:cytochrome c-type biogenesis protein CcmE
MHPLRRQRVYAIVTVLIGTIIAVFLVINALSKNMNLFFSPTEIYEGKVPSASLIRAGGMVKKGSIKKSTDSLEVTFIITDFKNSIPVTYVGILPDLFSENAGVVVQGRLGSNGNFLASEVLAKHDENYMPPEVAKILEINQ